MPCDAGLACIHGVPAIVVQQQQVKVRCFWIFSAGTLLDESRDRNSLLLEHQRMPTEAV